MKIGLRAARWYDTRRERPGEERRGRDVEEERGEVGWTEDGVTLGEVR